MFTIRLSASAAAVAAALVISAQAAYADPVVIEGVPLATHVVILSPAELANPTARDAVQRKLRSAAKAVCRAQYPGEMVYLFSHACYAGTLGDALGKLEQLRISLAARQSGGAQQLAIAVTAK